MLLQVTLFHSFLWLSSLSLQRRHWHPTPILLPGKSHGQRSLVGCSPWVAKSRTQLSDFPFTFHFRALVKEMATHSSVPAWRIPGTGEPGGLLSMGSHRVGHDWSDLAAAVAAAAAWGKSYLTTENTRQKEKPESGGVGTTRLGHSENQPTPGDGRLCGGGWEVLGELWNARRPDDRRRWLGRWLPREGRPGAVAPTSVSVFQNLSSFLLHLDSSFCSIESWCNIKTKRAGARALLLGDDYFSYHFIPYIAKALFFRSAPCHQLNFWLLILTLRNKKWWWKMNS